jgi:hypothetical protein
MARKITKNNHFAHNLDKKSLHLPQTDITDTITISLNSEITKI